jgi:nucleoside permease NupC
MHLGVNLVTIMPWPFGSVPSRGNAMQVLWVNVLCSIFVSVALFSVIPFLSVSEWFVLCHIWLGFYES